MSRAVYRAENGIGKQHFENLCKIAKNMIRGLSLSEILKRMKCDTSAYHSVDKITTISLVNR